MFVDLIPLLRLPKKLSLFTYSVPSALEGFVRVGQVVEAPFRGKKIQAVIKEVKEKSDFNPKYIKPLQKIADPEALFTPEQFSLADWLTDYYATALPLVIKSMMPKMPKRQVAVKDFKVNWDKFTAAKILTPKLAARNLLLFTTNNYLNNFLFSAIKATAGQILILAPEIADLPALGRLLSPARREQTAVVHSELNKNQYAAAWRRILLGEARVVVGTRSAIGLPFKQLKLIIVTAEHESSYKQWDQNPRYDARAAAEKLAEIFCAKIIFASPSPRVETYYQTTVGAGQLIKEPKNQVKTVTVDLKTERQGGNYSPLSGRLNAALLSAKQKKQKAVLYLNQRGLARAVVCGECGFVFNCPHCLLPLPLHQGGFLKCHHCNLQSPLPAACPNCRGTSFKFSGSGTEKLEKELPAIWPGAKILRLDSDVDFKKITGKQLAGADIYFGTDRLLNLVDWPAVGAIGLLFVDNLFYLPGFRSGERLWQLLKKFELAADRSGLGEFYLQTYNPDQAVIQKFIAKKDEEFYRDELETRRELNYPPYGRLARLIFQSPSQKLAEKSALELYRLLTNLQREAKIPAQINEPQPAFVSRVRSQFRFVIIIKATGPIGRLLEIVPEDWLIDIDPEDLI
ncbi:MAG: primosomal protein N' [Patescibacteria group bacterium]